MNNKGMDNKNIDKLWPHIHWLIVLAQQGSFTSAAKRLSVSKAAMSQRMVELERATGVALIQRTTRRSEAHTSELQSLMRISYAVFCLTKTQNTNTHQNKTH